MRSNLSTSFFLILFTIVLSSCGISTGMGEVKQDKESSTAISDLQVASANNAQAIEELKAENERLKGEIEKIRFLVGGKEETPAQVATTAASSTSTDSVQGVESVVDNVVVPTTSVAKQEGSIDERYKTARSLHEQKKYDEAEKYYLTIVDSPSVWYEERARFYLGILYYDKGDYEKAAVTLQEFADKYPKSKNLPTGLFTQAESFVALNKNSEAKIFFEDLISRFPKTKEAVQARKRLKGL